MTPVKRYSEMTSFYSFPNIYVPLRWKTIRIKFVAQIYGRIGFRGYTAQDLVDEGYGAITLSPSNIKTDKIDYEKCSYVSWEKYNESPEIMARNGDILFVKTGSSYGKSALISNLPMEATINPQLILFKNFNKINSKYFFYFLQSQLAKMQIDLIVTGGTIPTMSQEKILNFVLPYPSLNEQSAIASYLDEKCSKIDEIIASAKVSIEEYKKWKASIIYEAVTKGLDPDAEMKDSGIEWVGKIPKGWSVNVLFQLITQVKNKNVGLKEKNLLSLSYGKIKRKNIETTDGLLPASFDNYNIIEENDIVLRLTDLQNDHTSLRVGRVTERGIITSAYVTIRPFNSEYSEYLYFLLHSYDIKKGFYGMGSGVRQGLNFDEVKMLKIVLPPIDQQKRIVKYINDRCNSIDILLNEKQALIADLESYKKSLIYEVVTGKRKVI